MASIKFKEGDVVIICFRNNGHEFEIGDVVEIERVCDADYYAFNGYMKWYVCDDELIGTGVNVLD